VNKYQTYAAWAPPSSIWSVWAKPVVFAHMPAKPMEPGEPSTVDAPVPLDVPPVAERCAVILDLPAADAVAFAPALAEAGYRPVPLYNAAPALPPAPGGAALDVMPILRALRAAAPLLAALGVPDDAPPAFLLDARRSVGSTRPRPGVFDNRSISLPSDFPSAAFLQSHDVRQVLLVQATQIKPQSDLAHTLLRYQRAGLPVRARSLANEGASQPIRIARPSWFRSTLHHLVAQLGFHRSRLGGFGGELPEGSSGG